MNITCEQEALLKALSLLTQVVSNKPQSRPILANILLKASNDGLELTSTDMEMGIQLKIGLLNCFEEGEILLPAHQLSSILKEVPGEPISIEVVERTAILTGKRFQYKLPAYANEEFPEVPLLDGKDIQVPNQTVQRLLKEVSFAMNRDRNRFQLNSVLLCLVDDQFEAVATDQVRLAYSKTLMEREDQEEVRMVLPAKSLPVLNHILADDKNESITMKVGDAQVTFLFDQGFFIVRMVDAQFPNYRSAYSSYENVQDVNVGAQEIAQGMRQMMLLTCENARNITLILEQGQLTLKISTPLGEGQTDFPVEYEGEPVTVGINPYFVNDFLKEVQSQNIDTIRLKVVGARKPVIMSPHDNYLYFMSPISG